MRSTPDQLPMRSTQWPCRYRNYDVKIHTHYFQFDVHPFWNLSNDDSFISCKYLLFREGCIAPTSNWSSFISVVACSFRITSMISKLLGWDFPKIFFEKFRSLKLWTFCTIMAEYICLAEPGSEYLTVLNSDRWDSQALMVEIAE